MSVRILGVLFLALLPTGTAHAAVRLDGDLPRRADPGFRTQEIPEGLTVREVTRDSPAARAGVKVGDRLVAVGERAVSSARDGRDLLRRLPGRRAARFTVERDGRRLDLSFTPAPRPLEDLPGHDTVYGEVTMPDGARLRTVITRPQGATGPLPAIFLTKWVSCDGVEPLDEDAWGQVLRGLITRSNAVFIRVERAGGGDSEGPACHELDYDTELAHYQHAFDRLTRDPGIDADRVVLFGMSLGSTTAPLIAQGRKVAGVVVSGGGAFTYFERMLTFDRIGFERGGTPANEIDALVRRSAELHVEYLLRGRAPKEIAATRPDLGAHWSRLRGTGADDHYGRPFTWHQQAARKDLAAAWAAVDAPVLVVYGEYDQFEPPPAHRAIGEIVERAHPGRARVVEVPGMNHFYRVFADPLAAAKDEPGHDAPELAVAPMLEWLKERFTGILPAPCPRASAGSSPPPESPASRDRASSRSSPGTRRSGATRGWPPSSRR